MILKTPLLRWFWRQTLPVTLIALPVACLYVLLVREPLDRHNPLPALFILVHSHMILTTIWRQQRGHFAFLFERGYSRDAMWLHTIVVTTAAALAIWLPAAVIVWAPIRSTVQDVLFRSPYFPIMIPREAGVPWFWLFGYGLLLPVFHYGWIRMLQPTQCRYAGSLLATGLVVAAFVVLGMNYRVEWFQWLVLGASGVVALVALLAGWRLYRFMEVHAWTVSHL
jgi:hypothetical protein